MRSVDFNPALWGKYKPGTKGSPNVVGTTAGPDGLQIQGEALPGQFANTPKMQGYAGGVDLKAIRQTKIKGRAARNLEAKLMEGGMAQEDLPESLTGLQKAMRGQQAADSKSSRKDFFNRRAGDRDRRRGLTPRGRGGLRGVARNESNGNSDPVTEVGDYTKLGGFLNQMTQLKLNKASDAVIKKHFKDNGYDITQVEKFISEGGEGKPIFERNHEKPGFQGWLGEKVNDIRTSLGYSETDTDMKTRQKRMAEAEELRKILGG